MNTLGKSLRLTTFGESHGPAMGGILDGMPSGISIDMADIQAMIDRRRTGRDPLTSSRRETDIPEVLSGISSDGKTLGTSIGFIFRNSDSRSKDYDELSNRFRPNHADYAYQIKYGIRDYRGGGRASARETVNWVMGGALAMQWLKTLGITIEARLTQIGEVGYTNPFESVITNPSKGALPFDERIEMKMRDVVDMARRDCNSVGGRVSCIIKGIPGGLGEPVFGKAQAALAHAMMSLNAVKAFEYGLGCQASSSYGAETIDEFSKGFNPLPLKTNYQGGLLGGITTGMPVYFNLHFKPTPTIARNLPMPDKNGNIETICAKGRHDPCVAMRAPVIVESLAWLVIGDLLLQK